MSSLVVMVMKLSLCERDPFWPMTNKAGISAKSRTAGRRKEGRKEEASGLSEL